MSGLCRGCEPSAVWCDVHGDLWYDESGDQHRGNPPAGIPRRPESWTNPIFGLVISYVRDDGAIVRRSLDGEEARVSR